MFLLETEFREKYGIDKIARPEDEVFEELGVRLEHCDLDLNTWLPFPDNYFDVVSMLAVFEHIDPSALPALLGEIHRVLRPGGIYIVTTPAPWTPPLLSLLAHLRVVSRLEINEHKGAYASWTISNALRQAGFSAEGARFGSFECGMNVWGTAVKC